MAPQSLVITRPTRDVPACNPSLMPFHIDYTGPAAVSTFMRVENLKVEEKTEIKGASTKPNPRNPSNADVKMSSDASQVPTDDKLTSDGLNAETQSTNMPTEPALLAKSDSHTTIAASESQIATGSSAPSSSTTTVTMDATPPLLEDSDKHFVSSFRGRTIHGLTIDLPAGYGGLVLQSKDSEKEKETSKSSEARAKCKAANSSTKPSARGKEKEKEPEPKSATTQPRRGRLMRSAAVASNPTKPIVIGDGDDTVMEDATKAVEGDRVPDSTAKTQTVMADAVRRLVPSGQFSSFTLWQPDRVVDKIRNEYYRSLTEWISLAHEIHCVDFDIIGGLMTSKSTPLFNHSDQ